MANRPQRSHQNPWRTVRNAHIKTRGEPVRNTHIKTRGEPVRNTHIKTRGEPVRNTHIKTRGEPVRNTHIKTRGEPVRNTHIKTRGEPVRNTHIKTRGEPVRNAGSCLQSSSDPSEPPRRENRRQRLQTNGPQTGGQDRQQTKCQSDNSEDGHLSHLIGIAAVGTLVVPYLVTDSELEPGGCVRQLGQHE